MSLKYSNVFDLKTGATDSRAVSGYYDDWAGTYDETLKSWNYTAPADAAELLSVYLKNGNAILDVGCGTGLFGTALKASGFFKITGIDLSEESLKYATETGDYEALMCCDLQQPPLPLPDNSMDGAACVGVLTYIEDAEALLRDLCRVVKPRGVIAFTQRSDRWEELDFRATIEKMTRDGTWSPVKISKPKDYMPDNPDFADDIQVIHTLCKVG